MVRSTLWFPHMAILLMGVVWLAMGVGAWFFDHAGIDLWLAGVGGVVTLIGVGFRLAFTRYFPPTPPSGQNSP